MNAPLAVNIQRFCVHDGDGIRSTVFFKGCPLACRWCHNPETQSFQPQLMEFAERCTGCGLCVDRCPEKCIRMGPRGAEADRARCTACGVCAEVCPSDARSIAGREYPVEELARLLERDRQFYDNSGGGVTLSGGEPLAQDPDRLRALLRRLKRRGLHVAVDTCGDVPWASFENVLPYTDVFLYDLKAASPALHREFTGRDNQRILDNLARLSAAGAAINLRVPVIPGFNAGAEEQRAMRRIAEKLRLTRVNLLPYHNTGRDKWARLGVNGNEDGFTTPMGQEMEALAADWRAEGFGNVVIGG